MMFSNQVFRSQALSESNTSEPLPFVHWFVYAFVYGFLAFVSIIWLDSPRFVPIILIASITVATVQLAAVWCVYGTGNFLGRVACAFSMSSIVIAGIFFGVMPWIANMPSEATQVVKALACSFPMFCCAAQIPHWILRIGFGWQFVWNNQSPSPTFRLRDLFSITLLFAIALAGVRVAASNYADIFPDDVLVAVESTAVLPDDLGNGAQERRSSMERGIALGLFTYSAAFAVWSAMTVPLLFFVYRAKNAIRGVAICGIVVAVFLILVFLVASLASGIVMGLAGGFGALIGFLALSVFAFVLPVTHTRALGLEFKTNRAN